MSDMRLSELETAELSGIPLSLRAEDNSGKLVLLGEFCRSGKITVWDMDEDCMSSFDFVLQVLERIVLLSLGAWVSNWDFFVLGAAVSCCFSLGFCFWIVN